MNFAHKNRFTADGKMNFAPRSAEPIADQINAAIDRALEKEGAAQAPRSYLGGSRAGIECGRQLAYEYFSTREQRAKYLADPQGWTAGATEYGSKFPGKTIRRFRLGHIHEEETARWLRLAGFELVTHRPDGRQYGFAVAYDLDTGEPRFSGNIDGRIERGPIALPYPLLWEHKIMKSSKWKKMLEYGVAKVYPVYFGQIQLYMAYLELRHTLFTALNTDTSELHFELAPLDQQHAQWISDRAVTVLEAQAPEELPRIAKDPTDFRCKFCDYSDRCWSKGAEPAGQLAKPSWLGGGS